MQSSSFRLISAAISIFLLAALVTVIVVVIRDNPATALPIVTPTEAVAQAAAANANATLAAAPTLSTDNIEAVTPTPTALAEEASEATTETTETVPETTSGTATASSEQATAEPTSGTPTSTTISTTSRATSTSEPAGTSIAIPDAATATPAPTSIPPTFDPETGPQVHVYSNSNFVNGVASLRATLWAATSGGVVAWNKTTGSYAKFTTADGLAANHTISAVVCPLPGLGILFAGPLGIQIFDTQNGSWKTLNSSNSAMSHDDVSTLWCSASDGLLIVGYARAGLDLFNAREGTWTYIGEDEGLSVTGIRDLAVLDNGATIWMATTDGLAVYADGETNLYTTENSPLENNRIEAIAADGAGAIWLTSADTLYRTDQEEWDSYNADNRNFPSGRLVGLDVSNNGTIWIGSDQTQLCRFDPGVGGCIAFYSGEEGMASTPLTSLMIDSDGQVYYTTAGGGISIFDGTTWQQLVIADEVTPGNTINAITQASDGSYWLAGNGGSSHVTMSNDSASNSASDSSSEAISVDHYTPANSPLPSINVRVIFPTTAGVWFGTETATFFDGERWTTYGPEEGLTGTAVQAITADAQNRIWLGTNAGLSIWTGSAFFNLTSDNGLPSEDITALQRDGSAVWIGTQGGGLLRFQDNQLQLFNRNNSNLPGNIIYALALTQDGELLIATEQGLARYRDGELTVESTLDAEAIIALAVSPSGEVWVATDLNELHFFNGVEWAIMPSEKLPAPEINTLFFDAEGTLWIGTAQGGAARLIP